MFVCLFVFQEWVKAVITNVADMVILEDIVPFQTVYSLIGLAPNKIPQYNVARTAVRSSLQDFDIKAFNVGLTESPLYHDEKIYTVSNFRKTVC